MNKKRKNIFFSILAIILFIGIAGSGIVYYYLFYPQFHPSKTTYIYIDRDDTTDSIFNKIKSKEILITLMVLNGWPISVNLVKTSTPDVTLSNRVIMHTTYIVGYQEDIKHLSI